MNLDLALRDAIPFDVDRRFVRCRATFKPDGTVTFDKLERSAVLAGFYWSTTAGVIESRIVPPAALTRGESYTVTELVS